MGIRHDSLQRLATKVSIIVPLYNAERYAQRVLSEICGQSYEHLEILLIDDGSSDGTGHICAAWAKKDARVRYICQENAGVGAARNRGLEEAMAPLVMFVDADDEIDYDFVERLVQPLVETDADMSVADIDNIYSSGVHSLSVVRLPYGVTETECDSNIISKIRTFCWGKIYRRSLWDENSIRFPEGKLYSTMPGFEDVCCLPLLAARARRIVHVGGTYYHYYRGHEGSLMHEAKFRYFLNSQYELLHRFDVAGLSDKFHPALRKFVLGQLVSGNRWKLQTEEIAAMWELVEEYFPELVWLRGKTVYAPQGLAYDVLSHVFFDKTQLSAKAIPSQVKVPLPEQVEDYEHYENYCYDLADRIIDMLPLLKQTGGKNS